MQVAPPQDPTAPGRGAAWELYQLEAAHGLLNAAYGAIATTQPGIVTPAWNDQIALIQKAQLNVQGVLAGDARADAVRAAREVLPHITRAAEVLAAIHRPVTPAELQPLLDDMGAAMDHIETLLGAVDWE